jgi:hypothetical protein
MASAGPANRKADSLCGCQRAPANIGDIDKTMLRQKTFRPTLFRLIRPSAEGFMMLLEGDAKVI